MDNEIVQEILDRLDSAGELATQGFEVIMQQVYVTATGYALATVVAVVISFVSYRLVKNFGYLGGERIWATGHYDAPEIGGVTFGILGVVSGLWAISFFWSAVARFINPEFYAIKYVLNTVS